MKYEKGSFITVPSREKLAGLNPTAQALYMWLCAYANETGNCYPSRATLAEKVGCSERTIDLMVQILVENGLIRRINRYKENQQLSNYYTVLIVAPLADSATPLAGIATPPLQILRTELNPVLTQETSEQSSPLLTIEKYNPDQTDTPLKKEPTPKYEDALKWAEKRTGRKFVNRTKQYKAIKVALAAGHTETDLIKRWKELETTAFFQDNGFDWTSVASSFDKR